MIKKGYEVMLHAGRSPYGVELDISVPGSDAPVIVSQDVFGEEKERMQLFVSPSGAEEVEAMVSIRFNDDGSIAGVVVPDGVPVEGWCAPSLSVWMKERDGG